MNPFHPYSLFPLGDRGLLIDFGNLIDENINQKVLRLFDLLKKAAHPFITDLIPAYSSLSVCYDVTAIYPRKEKDLTVFETMAGVVEDFMNKEQEIIPTQGRQFNLPVCYTGKWAPDIQFVSRQNHISVEDIIRLHTSQTYRVFMIGFLPGFAYMGQIDDRIAVPRKPKPQDVLAGAVGIAGHQTGVYPLNAPGGWHIIGRTPVKLFDKCKEPAVLLKPADTIKFYSITEDEFAHYQTGPA